MNKVGWVMLLFGLMTAAWADSTPPNVLPGPPSVPSEASLKNFHLHDFVARDATGQPLTNMPAALIDILSGTGDWDTTNPSKVPALIIDIPTDLREQLQIFYKDNGVGWVIVPRGWKVWRAVEGVDGNEWFTFVSPAGPNDGWMITGDVPACIGCMYSDADGLIPGAHQVLIDFKIADAGTSPARIVPTPASISHPNDCTAVLTYHKAQSPPVRAVVFVGIPAAGGDPSEVALYLALPAGMSKVAEFIADNFKKLTTSCGGVAPQY
ncbi:MAG TPA: DUF4850 domain-containing protein [Gammaproteobacteria bacterium]|nr:DUF4850 domain-containing protein [Gammaproteobacteria bacterium]